MAFFEAELVFLALIFIFALGFLMSLLGRREKQHLNSKENKIEEKRTQKSDTQTLPRQSVQDKTRT